MDNRIFNVNGRGSEMLLRALELIFEQEGDKTKAKAWMFSEKHGLILTWYEHEKATNLPAPMTAKQVLPFVEAWLEGPEAAAVKLDGWDKDADHDGSNGKGWRVYCEDWGHVASIHSAICAIKPVFLWYGK